MKFIDLFGGVGGFRLGLEQASDKYECVWYCDNDKYAVSVYNHRFGESYEPRNIRDVRTEEIPECDIVCGGFPCQSFSIAGKRGGFEDTRGTLFFEIARIIRDKKPKIVFLENVKGLLNHKGGKTFRTIINTLGELGYDIQWMVLNSRFHGVPQNRERVFIIGNLRGEPRPEILPFRESTGKISRVSKEEKPRTIAILEESPKPKGNYLPRERVLDISKTSRAVTTSLNQMPMIVDYRTDEGYRERDNLSPCLTSHGNSNGGIPVPMVMNLQKRDINRPAIRKRIEAGLKPNAGSGTIGKEDEAYCLDAGCNQGVARCLDSNMHKGVTPEYYFEKKKRNVVSVKTPERKPRQQGRWVKNPEEETFTINSQDRDGIMEYDKLRRLTPVECERLQGFPDGWTEICSDTQRYRQMGNAVTVNVIRAIGRKLINEI